MLRGGIYCVQQHIRVDQAVSDHEARPESSFVHAYPGRIDSWQRTGEFLTGDFLTSTSAERGRSETLEPTH